MGYVRRSLGDVWSDSAHPLGDAWSDYLATGRGPAGGRITSPNGLIVVFDDLGGPDYTITPTTALPTDTHVEQDTHSTFYGWTELEKDAFEAAQLPGSSWTGIVTDYLRARAIYAAGSSTPTYSVADQAESDRQLRAYAVSTAKIQAALSQAATGTFRGAQQTTFDANEAARVQADAQDLLDRWTQYRQSLVNAKEPNANQLPIAPPTSWTGPLTAAVASALAALVAKLPPSPPPTMQPSDANVDEIPDTVLLQALDAIDQNGGDVTQPTALVDQTTGNTVAVLQQLPNGNVQVQPASSQSVGSVVQSVTGFIDRVAGELSQIGTQLQKTGNAVKGAAAGAQAGYNAPTDWKPIVIGVGALVGGLALVNVLRKR